ncbi:MAG: multiheme c-type cytochrome, partial [Terriglobales bacterium]
ADQSAKFAKASFDAALYTYESSLATKPKAAPAARRERDKIEQTLNAADLKLAQLKLEESQVQAEIKRITARRDNVQVAIQKLTADYRLARNKLETLRQDTLFALRNSPILDMVNPSLRVQQVQLPELYNDVNFMKIPKVDRCETCHIAAERTGFEDAKLNPVFRTHPRLSLMVGGESPHPANAFGCTSCHGGRDRASSFWSAGHSPQDARQEKRWEQRFEWEFDRFNDTPVLPLKHAEAGCYRCHAGETNFPSSPTLDAGMRMVETLGCWGCHRVADIEAQKLPKPGPSLEKLAAKAPKDWAIRWVANPPAFRASTRMPSFFYQENYVNVSGSHPPTPAQTKMTEQGRIENHT